MLFSDLPRVADIFLELAQVQVVPVKVLFEIDVITAQILLQSLGGAFIESGGFVNQIGGGAENHNLLPVFVHLARDAAQHELRKQPVVAFFQIAAVGHLRENIRAAEQAADQLEMGRNANAAHRHFIAGEMQHARRLARVVTQSNLR